MALFCVGNFLYHGHKAGKGKRKLKGTNDREYPLLKKILVLVLRFP